jgi:hypothetical protein
MKQTGNGKDAGSGAAAQTVTVRSLLVGWANEQDAWGRELVSEVILAGKPLTESQLDAVYQMFLREKALAPGGPVSVAALTDDASLLDAGAGLYLTHLGDLKNVNALAHSQRIVFNAKLTIVFGENACGKTGYVRVLKKAAAVRTSETILPDVSQGKHTGGSPCARIGYKLGPGDEQVVDWQDEAGLAPLNRIDVFDARAALLHVDGDLNYIYTPGELARFPLVQRSVEGVRSRLESEVSAKTQTVNPFLVQFDRQSSLYPVIESLGASTDLAQLKSLAAVTEAEKQEIETLKTEIDALRSTNPAAQLALAQTRRQHLDALVKAFSAIGRFDIPLYMERVTALRRAERAYESATQESFAGLPIPGLLKEEWRDFIRAGEDYLRTLESAERYPAEGKQCLYCRQPLAPEAVALLRKYRDFCNNDLRIALDAAVRDVDAMRRAFEESVDFDDVDGRLAEVSGEGGAIRQEQLATLNEFVAAGRRVRDAIRARASVEWSDQAAKSTQVLTLLEVARAQNNSLMASLTDRRDQREAALRQKQARLLTCSCRLDPLMTVHDPKWA